MTFTVSLLIKAFNLDLNNRNKLWILHMVGFPQDGAQKNPAMAQLVYNSNELFDMSTINLSMKLEV